MPKFKATKNFYLAQSDRHFDKDQVYDLQVSDADEINKKIKIAYGEEWLERLEEVKQPTKADDTAS